MSFANRLALIALFVLALRASSFAQAPGHIRLKLVKAGLVVGGGVLTYRVATTCSRFLVSASVLLLEHLSVVWKDGLFLSVDTKKLRFIRWDAIKPIETL